ncbi:hypothetical protein NL676_028380 [Syzygium grande]|nr:hypothetical protein NL676_028380 [Syzygium grande]
MIACSIMRDPELQDNPEKFWLERSIGNAIDMKGQDFELVPFGSKHMTKKDLNMEEIPGLFTPRKIPLVAIAEPKLPLHLY